MKKKRKMKTSKKAFWAMIIWALAIQAFVMAMIYKLHDTVSLSILTTTAFAEVFAVYKLYLNYNQKINLKHMEQNYQSDYDEREGLK